MRAPRKESQMFNWHTTTGNGMLLCFKPKHDGISGLLKQNIETKSQGSYPLHILLIRVVDPD
jgi:hypothetical protein